MEGDASNYHLYGNRAACHLKLQSPSKAHQDCCKALELIKREEDILREELIQDDIQSRESRNRSKLKLFLRRGAAEVDMGNIAGARRDFESALTLDPNNPEIMSNLKTLTK